MHSLLAIANTPPIANKPGGPNAFTVVRDPCTVDSAEFHRQPLPPESTCVHVQYMSVGGWWCLGVHCPRCLLAFRAQPIDPGAQPSPSLQQHAARPVQKQACGSLTHFDQLLRTILHGNRGRRGAEKRGCECRKPDQQLLPPYLPQPLFLIFVHSLSVPSFSLPRSLYPPFVPRWRVPSETLAGCARPLGPSFLSGQCLPKA